MQPGRDSTAIGWAALLTLTLTPLLPGRAVVVDLATVAGLLLLAWHATRPGACLLPNRWVRWGVLAFAASVVLSTLLPPLLGEEDAAAGIARNLHPAWDTVQALVAGGLCLLILRRERDLAFYCLALAAVLLCLSLWAPLDLWLRGRLESVLIGHNRLTGSKGTAHRWAAALYLTLFPVWMLLLSARLREATLSGWRRPVGLLTVLLTAFALLRKDLPDVGADAPWWPQTSQAAHGATFVLLACAVAASGLLAWRRLATAGRGRTLLAIGAVAAAAANVAASGARLHTLLLLAAGAAGLLFRFSNRLRVLLGFGAAGAVVVGVLLLHPATFSSASVQYRLHVWRQLAPLLSEAPAFGIGYGNDAFRDAWVVKADARAARLPDGVRPTAFEEVHHAHNLWMQILIERGVVGLIAFHLLWGALAWTLLRELRRAPPGPDAPPDPARETRRVAAAMALVAVTLLVADGLLNWPLMQAGERLFAIMTGIGLAACHPRRRAGRTEEPASSEASPSA